jgi:WS/DGAT/MGAT family acyltransferase
VTGSPAERCPRLRPDQLAYSWLGTRETPMQIALLGIFDAGPLRRATGTVDVDRVRAELAQRAALLPELRRRVVRTRLGEGGPVWAEDPSGDPLDAITPLVLPPGADLPQWAAGRAALAVPPDRPPWRIDVIDGLPGGGFAVLVVVSHVLADGLAGVALAGRLLDPRPDVVAPFRLPEPVPALPTHRELRRRRRSELRAALRRPRPRSAAPRLRLRDALAQVRDAMSSFAGPEPATPLPRRIGSGRRLAAVHVPLGELQRTGRALGVTVNDLFLAAVAGGLRSFLAARGDLAPGQVLRATVPVALRGTGHQVMAALVVGLPVGEPDPARRLALVHGATAAGKTRIRSAGGDFTDLRLPALLARPVLRWTRRSGSRRLTLAVTDVPGPAAPLWLAGAPLRAVVPIAPMSPEVPLSVAALSYAGDLAVSINADAAAEGLDDIATGTARAFAELGALAAATSAHSTAQPLSSAGRGPSEGGDR